MLRPRVPATAAVAAFAAILVAAPAQAHMVSPDVGDFYAGMLHPLTSAEHVLPMLALALLASQCGNAAARAVIWLFPLALAAGILAGAFAPTPRAAFYADALATTLLGLGIMAAPRLPAPRGVAAVAALAVGLILGWRSGGDWAASPAGWRFVPGAAVTGLTLTALVVAWVPRLAAGRAGKLRLLVGGLVAIGGLLTGAGLFGGAPAAPALPRLPTEGELAALARTVGDSPQLLVAAILGAFAWGAGHALTPGHGKALVGAYLVGSRGTPGQAVLLGGLVTLTHTLGVFALGGVVWLAAGSLDQEQLSPWLSLVSGLGVAGVGIGLFFSRLRGLGLGHGHSHEGASHSHGGLTHSHGGLPHSHGGLPLDGQKPGRRRLLALGVSGGLVPCPGALVLLLGAVAVGRIGLGLALVAAFSLGLATVLTAVGLLFLKGARFLENAPAFAVAARWLPVAAALAVTGLGLALTVEAGRSLLGG